MQIRKLLRIANQSHYCLKVKTAYENHHKAWLYLDLTTNKVSNKGDNRSTTSDTSRGNNIIPISSKVNYKEEEKGLALDNSSYLGRKLILKDFNTFSSPFSNKGISNTNFLLIDKLPYTLYNNTKIIFKKKSVLLLVKANTIANTPSTKRS